MRYKILGELSAPMLCLALSDALKLHGLQKMSKQRKAAIIVQTARDSLSTAALGGSFILTDNLLTPYVAGVLCDFLFSVYQRAKFNSLQSKTQQHMMSMLEDFQEVKKASQRLKVGV